MADLSQQSTQTPHYDFKDLALHAESAHYNQHDGDLRRLESLITNPSVSIPAPIVHNPVAAVNFSPDAAAFGRECVDRETNVDEHGRRKNTPLAYDPKLKEFKEYCDVFHAGRPQETR